MPKKKIPTTAETATTETALTTEQQNVAETVVKQKRPARSEALKVQTDNPEKMQKILQHGFQIASLPSINTSDPVAVENRTMEYFRICVENVVAPTVPGLALALGVDRKTVWEWSNGNGKGKNAEICNTIKKAYVLMNTFMEQYSHSGQINPVSAIFLMKNNFGYQDKQEVVLSPGVNMGAEAAESELSERYIETVTDDESSTC